MRISDWSSDVCSSDLLVRVGTAEELAAEREGHRVGEGVDRGLGRRVAGDQLVVRGGGGREAPHGGGGQQQGGGEDGSGADARLCGDHVSSLTGPSARSEGHTSELQSLMRSSYAVFCLTKKKTTLQNHGYTANA